MEMARQVDLVVADRDDALLPDDVEAVHGLARRTRLALGGDVDAADRDGAGDTRSV